MMPLYGCSSIEATCVLIGNSHGSPRVTLVYIREPLMYHWRHAEMCAERTVDSWQRWRLRAKIAPGHSRMIGIEMYGCFPLENRACASAWIFSMLRCMCIYICIYMLFLLCTVCYDMDIYVWFELYFPLTIHIPGQWRKVFLYVNLYRRKISKLTQQRYIICISYMCHIMNSVLGAIVSTPDLKHSLARRGTTRDNALYVHSSGSVGMVDEY